VSPYECSGTPGPKINRTLRHNVPGLIREIPVINHYSTIRSVHNDRDVSMQRHCVSGTIHLGDQGSQNIRTGTHRFGTSRHPIISYRYTIPVLDKFQKLKISDPDSLNPDPDPANWENPDLDPDPGLKKLFKIKVLKIEFKWTFLN